MNVLAGPRGSKKSWKLLKDCSDNNGVILTLDKRALQVKAESYGFKDIKIIDLEDFDSYDENKPLYIHKADNLLEELMKQFGFTVNEIMVTTEE